METGLFGNFGPYRPVPMHFVGTRIVGTRTWGW